MATAVITEFSDLSFDSKGNVVPVGNLSLIVASTSVTYTTSQEHTLDQKTRFVRIKCDADAYVAEGDSPTATTGSLWMEADVAEYFGVQTPTRKNRKIALYDGAS